MNKVELTLDKYEDLKNEVEKAKAESVKKTEQINKNAAFYAEEKTKLEKELYEVNADKRVLKITKTVDDPYARYMGVADFSIDLNSIMSAVNRYNGNRPGISNVYPTFSSYGQLEAEIKRNIRPSYPYGSMATSTSKSTHKEEKEFVNFEDVKKEYEAQLDKNNAAELAELRVVRDTLQQTIEDNIAKNTKFQVDLEEKKQQAIEEAKKLYDRDIAGKQKNIDDLTQAYDDLKNDKDTRKREKILEDKIVELKEALKRATRWKLF